MPFWMFNNENMVPSPIHSHNFNNLPLNLVTLWVFFSSPPGCIVCEANYEVGHNDSLPTWVVTRIDAPKSDSVGRRKPISAYCAIAY